MKSVAFFDFDGTLTTKDTLFEFIKFYRGSIRFYLGVIFLSPYFIALKFGLISAQKAKELVLGYFFRNTKTNNFNTVCSQFTSKLLPHIIRPGAVQKINWHIEQEHDIFIVSASPKNWIQPWAKEFGIKVISTLLETVDEKLTGRISGKNCNGLEKVERIKKEVKLKSYDEIYAYGDTSGDKEMLALANHKFFKPFRD